MKPQYHQYYLGFKPRYTIAPVGIVSRLRRGCLFWKELQKSNLSVFHFLFGGSFTRVADTFYARIVRGYISDGSTENPVFQDFLTSMNQLDRMKESQKDFQTKWQQSLNDDNSGKWAEFLKNPKCIIDLINNWKEFELSDDNNRSEYINRYQSSLKDAENHLNEITRLLLEKCNQMTGEVFCEIIVALSYYSLCFTEATSKNILKNRHQGDEDGIERALLLLPQNIIEFLKGTMDSPKTEVVEEPNKITNPSQYGKNTGTGITLDDFIQSDIFDTVIGYFRCNKDIDLKEIKRIVERLAEKKGESILKSEEFYNRIFEGWIKSVQIDFSNIYLIRLLLLKCIVSMKIRLNNAPKNISVYLLSLEKEWLAEAGYQSNDDRYEATLC